MLVWWSEATPLVSRQAHVSVPNFKQNSIYTYEFCFLAIISQTIFDFSFRNIWVSTAVTSPTTETLSGYGLVVAPTGGEIEATGITINAAEGKKYYIYQMYEGKVGKISVDGEIVAQSNK